MKSLIRSIARRIWQACSSEGAQEDNPTLNRDFGAPVSAADFQQSHLFVNVVLVSGPLLSRVPQIGGRAAVDVGFKKLAGANG